MTNAPSQVREGAIGASSGVMSIVLGWLDPIGHIASSLGAIATCIISLVMLYRILFRGGGKRGGANNRNQEKKASNHD